MARVMVKGFEFIFRDREISNYYCFRFVGVT